MRVSLVPSLLYHPYNEQPYADFPLGILSIASVLENCGASVQINDLNISILDGELDYTTDFYTQAADLILANDPEMVGFSSLCTSFLQTLRLAETIRARNPNVFILFGGPNATFVAKSLLTEFTAIVDAVVLGEGERVIDRLAAAWHAGKDLEQVPGLFHKRSPGPPDTLQRPPLITDLDELPQPAWHLYPVSHGLARGYWSGLEIEAGRGCPFSCNFCTTSLFWDRRFRVKSPGHLVGEMIDLRQRYKVDSFSLVHDLLTFKKDWIKSFCSELIQRNCPIQWSMSSRADSLTPDLLDLLAQAGCRTIYYGIESGSSRMQKLTRKNLKMKAVRRIVAMTQAAGIQATASFIMGFPEEEIEDLEKTLDLFCLYKSQERAQLHLLALYPGIPLIKNQDRLHFDIHLPDGALDLHTENDIKLVRTHPKIFLNYYYTDTRINRELLKGIQAYYLATTNYLAHLVAKYALGASLFKLACDWIENTRIRFDPSRLNLMTLEKMGEDIGIFLKRFFAHKGKEDLFDEICRFQRAGYVVRQQVAEVEERYWEHDSTPGVLTLASKLTLRSPVEVLALQYDIPTILESIADGQPVALTPEPVRYMVHLANDRLRYSRLNAYTAEFLALCLRGRTLADISATIGMKTSNSSAATNDDLAATTACLWKAKELVNNGILGTVSP